MCRDSADPGQLLAIPMLATVQKPDPWVSPVSALGQFSTGRHTGSHCAQLGERIKVVESEYRFSGYREFVTTTSEWDAS